jgi:hypothetical protein
MQFAWQDDPTNILCTSLTDTSGLAECIIYPSQPILGGGNYVATFTAIANEFLLSLAVTTGATSTLQSPAGGPASIGHDWTVYGILNRVSGDGFVYPPAGSVIKFAITRPDGQQTVINGATTQITPTTVQWQVVLRWSLRPSMLVWLRSLCRLHL